MIARPAMRDPVQGRASSAARGLCLDQLEKFATAHIRTSDFSTHRSMAEKTKRGQDGQDQERAGRQCRRTGNASLLTRAAIPAWRRMSGSPMTETSAVSLSRIIHRLPRPGQGDADQLRQDDLDHGLEPVETQRIAAFILAVIRDGPEGGQEHLAGKGRKDHAQGDHAGKERVDLDLRIRSRGPPWSAGCRSAGRNRPGTGSAVPAGPRNMVV